MKIKIFFLSLIIFGAFLQPARAETLTQRLQGRILLQVQNHGEAWYVNPVDSQRYYLKDGQAAYELMRQAGLGTTNSDLEKIPVLKNQTGDKNLTDRLRGRILLQVENHGEAWYVNPVDGLRYYLKDGETAYEIMRTFGLGITNADLRKITINSKQIIFDNTFNQVAHVKYSAGSFSRSFYADDVLPLASLSKLMTALVILDLKPDWSKLITITQSDLDYPKSFVAPDDVTSEINLQLGDIVTFQDLWRAMLVASSNQAAGILAKNSGVALETFIIKMNAKAKELGLTKTVFADPSGLSVDNLSTAKEMAKIAAAAFGLPLISETTINNFTITAKNSSGETREIKVTNRNYSLLNFGVDAAKSGFLYEAQRNAAIKKGDSVIVVLHARSMKERNYIIEQLLK